MDGRDKKKKTTKGSTPVKRSPKQRKPSKHDAIEPAVDIALEEDMAELEKGIFFAAEAAIDEAIRLNCDVSEAQLYLEKGRAQFKLGNFDYADNYCQLALNAAKESSKRIRTEALFHEIARMIKDNAELYSNIEEIESSYREAEQQFEAGNYDNAMDYLEGIKKNAIDTIFDNIINETETKLQTLAERIRKYKRKKVDVTAPLEKLNKANEAFDDNDYLTANELAEEAIQLLNTSIEPELREKATEVLEKMNKLQVSEDLDKDALNEAAPFFNNIQQAFDSGDFEYVIERERELTDIAERIIKIGKLTEYQMIQEKIKSLEEGLSETEQSGIEVSDIRKALEKSKKALEGKNFESAREWLQKSHQLEEKVRDQYLEKKVESIIFSAQSLINEIADTGANVEDAENRLATAKKLLGSKNFDESRKIAEQTIIIARENLLGHLKKRAEGMLIKNQKILKDLSSRSIDVSKEDALFIQAQESYKKGDFTEAIETLSRLEESTMKLLNKDLSFQVIESLKQFEEKINEAREFDIPVDDFVKLLEDVKLKLEDENYVDAERIISNSLQELNDKLKDLTLRKKLNEILSDIESIRNLKVGVKRLEALADRASGALTKGNMASAEDTINKLYVATKKTLTETYSLRVGKQLRNLETKVKGIKERGLDTHEIDMLYNDAVEALRNRDYQSALALLNKGDDLIDEYLQEDQAFKLRSELDNMVNSINEFKIAGLDVEKLEKTVKNIKIEIDEKDYSSAKDLIRQTEKGLLQLKESKKVNALLEDIKAEIAEVRELGINVAKVEDAYDQAVSAAKRNDLRRAVDIGRDISSILSMIKKDRLKRQAKELIDVLELEIKKARENNIEIENSDELLTLAKDALNRNEFDDSIKYSRQVESILRKEEKAKLSMNVQRKLEVFQFEIEQASNQGLDVSQYKKSINDIKTLLEEGKPNPANDVLNFSQRSFKKALSNFQEEKKVAPAREPEVKTTASESQVYASSSPLMPEDMGEIGPGSDASTDTKASTAAGKTELLEDRKKFNSLGNVGMKTLEGMSAKAGSIMETDEQADLEKELQGLVEDDIGLPFIAEEDKKAAAAFKKDVADAGVPVAEVRIPELSEKEIKQQYELNKAELTKLKKLERIGLKANITQLESLVNATELALGENNLKTADKFVLESAELITKNLRPMRLQFMLTRLKGDIEDLWASGEKLEKPESLLNKSRKELEARNYDGAEPLINELEQVVGKLKEKRLLADIKKRILEAEKKLKGLEQLDIDKEKLKSAVAKLHDVHRELKDENISLAMERIMSVISDADALEQSFWIGQLEKTRSEIAQVMNQVPGGSAEEIEVKIKDLFERSTQLQGTGSFKKALKLLTDGKKSLESDVDKLKAKLKTKEKELPETKQMEKAKKAFEKMVSKPAAKPKEAETELELDEDIGKEKELVEEPAVKEVGKRTVTIPLTAPPDDSIDPEIYSRGLITDVVLLMQHVKDDNQNVEEPDGLLQKAKEEFIVKDYDKANELAFSARDILIKMKPELFADQAGKDIEDLKRYFEDLRSIGVETEPLERNMKTIIDDLNNREYIKVLDSCLKLKNKAKRLKMEFLKVTLRPNIEDLQKELEAKKKDGIDVAEIASYLADAEDSISDEDFDGACAIYKKALELYNTMPTEEERRKQDLENRLGSIKKKISESTSYKLDFIDVEKLYPGIEDNLANNALDDAELGLKDAARKLNDVLRKYAVKVLKRVELEIEDVMLSGADPVGAKEQFNKGQKQIQAEEMHEAIKTLESAERLAAETGDTFVKVFEGLRNLTRQISRLSPEMDNYEELVSLRNETKKRLEKKDYLNALTTLNKAVQLLPESEE